MGTLSALSKAVATALEKQSKGKIQAPVENILQMLSKEEGWPRDFNVFQGEFLGRYGNTFEIEFEVTPQKKYSIYDGIVVLSFGTDY